jgi:hypothetical protein
MYVRVLLQVSAAQQEAVRASAVPVDLAAASLPVPAGASADESFEPSSSSGVGTCVRFALLLQPASAAPAAPDSPAVSRRQEAVPEALRALPTSGSSELPSGLHVLVADDQRMNRRMLRLYLESKHLTAHTPCTPSHSRLTPRARPSTHGSHPVHALPLTALTASCAQSTVTA